MARAGAFAGKARVELVELSSEVVNVLLEGILALDVISFALVASALLLVALAASALPAWRASNIDPLIAIRRE